MSSTTGAVMVKPTGAFTVIIVTGKGKCIGAGGSIMWQDRPMAPDWDAVSDVVSSTYRVAVLERLAIGPATPSQIAEDREIPISHVSRALGRLREQSLVELLVSDDRRKGRVYGITDHGSEIWQTIEAENLA